MNMKHFFFIDLLSNLLVGYFNLQAQSYIPMLNDSAVWVMGERNPSINIPLRYYQVSVVSVIQSPSHPYPQWHATSSPPAGVLSSYFISEDTTNRKIYLQDLFTNNWTILYNFNVQQGDTVSNAGLVFPSFELNLRVDSVKTQFFANANRRFIFLSPIDSMSTDRYVSMDYNPLDSLVDGPLVWIEGIGSQHGLNYLFNNFITSSLNQYNFLSCRYDHGTLTYQHALLQSCTQPLGIASTALEPSHKAWEVYFSSIGQLEVVAHKGMQEPFQLTVTDKMGRKLITKEYERIESGGKLSIHDHFPYGVLFCTIHTSNSLNHFKLFRL